MSVYEVHIPFYKHVVPFRAEVLHVSLQGLRQLGRVLLDFSATILLKKESAY